MFDIAAGEDHAVDIAERIWCVIDYRVLNVLEPQKSEGRRRRDGSSQWSAEN